MNRFTQKTFAIGLVAMIAMCGFSVVWVLVGASLGFDHMISKIMMGITIGTITITGITIIPALSWTFRSILKDAKKLWDGDNV